MTSNIRSKNIYEALMLKNRMAESKRQNEMRENTKFFRDSEVRARQEKKWTSENFYNSSIISYLMPDKEAIEDKLHSRKEKLRRLLREEFNFYAFSLNQSPENKNSTYFSSTNQPNCSVCGDDAVQDEQDDPFKGADLKSASPDHFHSELQKKEQILQQKTEELKHFDAETEELNRIENEILEYQKNLRQLLNERQGTVESRLQKRFEKVLLRQQAAALRRRSRQVQQDLTSDLAWLDRLFFLEREEENCDNQLNAVRETLTEVLQREKLRESEMDDLVSSELAELAKKRELEWKHEAEARDKLLNDVAFACKKRADSRMKALHLMRSEREEKYASLLREIEAAKQFVHTNNDTPDICEPIRSSHLHNMDELCKGKEDARVSSPPDHEPMASDVGQIE